MSACLDCGGSECICGSRATIRKLEQQLNAARAARAQLEQMVRELVEAGDALVALLNYISPKHDYVVRWKEQARAALAALPDSGRKE